MRANFHFTVWLAMLSGLVSALSLAHAAEPFVASYDRFYAKSNSELELAEAGQLLLTELSCTACHTADERLKPKGGPTLTAVSSRLQTDWIGEYLASPSNSKSGNTMPHMLHLLPHLERAEAIEALVAFLSLGDAIEPKIVASGAKPVAHEFWLKGIIEQGRERYHQIGCIACHSIDQDFQLQKTTLSDLERKIDSLGLEPDELEAMGLVIPKPIQPVPMSQIEKKYSLRSLSMFLLAPHLARPAGRMPSLKLEPNEAADIAAYLFRNADSTRTSITDDASAHFQSVASSKSADLFAKGKKLYEQLSCANCHANPKARASQAVPLAKLDVSGVPKGCLANAAHVPQFGLSERQVNALRVGIANWQRSPAPSSSVDLKFKLLQLNCYACHEREGRGGVGPQQWPYFENVQQVDIGDEGRIPPPLDHVGSKLKASWLQKIFDGKGDVRPHFRARMPIFSEHAKLLATAFESVDRVASHSSNTPFNIANPKQPDLVAGRELLDTGCVQCHTLRGESLPGSIGIDIADVESRIYPDWFQAFLLNPASLKKNTRMPSFFPDGKSSSPHILNGDVVRQIASIWSYLNTKDQPLPAKLEQSRSQYFELKPIDRPIVLRTFMESNSAGTHAIAVGFAEQRHFAFDAKNLHLSEIWKGSFLNAQGTWFDRFAPPAIPLGTDRVLFPIDPFSTRTTAGTMLAISQDERSFHGFRLDEKGVPTFRYSIESIAIEDQIEPHSDVGLVRRFSLKNSISDASSTSNELWITLVDDALQVDASGVCSTRSGLKIVLPEDIEHRIYETGNESRLMIQLAVDSDCIEVRYQW
ncbi:MAG: cytochrome c [Pirellulaceae bacterium]|nr:cytochrome c [Pirellulaceae bacterium]